jgi:3-isopropylmalate/(R)-2-methylmalate dehydratase small subunit
MEGRARIFGDDVNTDYIISSARKRASIDASALAAFLFESIAPGFAASVQTGDILVAGRNFGCGSAMEVAATVIQAAGIRAVLAKSFSRSFYRNAINNGLLVVECDTSHVAEGDQLVIALTENAAEVRDLTRDIQIHGAPLPDIMLRILGAGGLVGFLREHRGWS